MKLAPILLAAPVVFTMVAADPRPTAAPDRRVLDRWRFARQDEPASGTGGGASASTPAAPASTKETPTSTASPTSAAAETTSTPVAQPPTTTTTTTTPPVQSPTSSSTPVVRPPTSTSSVSTPNLPTSNSTPVQSPSSQSPAPIPTTESTTSMSTPPPSTTFFSTTDGSGRAITSIVVYTLPASGITVPASASSTPNKDKEGISQSTIVGLGVTGGIAGLLVILLIVWKLTNKRFSDLDDTEDDAIKWPELHKDSAAMTPIPARPTPSARAETDTLGTDFDRQSAAHSTADLQYPPYSDDPGYGARPAYYDPYGGTPGAAKLYPSPPGSHDGDHKNWGGPADAQYYDAARGASPAPNTIARGMSPGPGMAYDTRVASPAPPNMAYADQMGRTGSPGPATGGYGYAGGYAQPDPYGGRHSPGPNMAYGQPEVDPYGRRSPGPGMAYNGSVGRVASPGPGAAYR